MWRLQAWVKPTDPPTDRVPDPEGVEHSSHQLRARHYNMRGGSTMIHSRRLRAVPTLALLGWVLTLAGPIAAKTITYTPQQFYYTYCFSHPPAARIASGDTVITKT